MDVERIQKINNLALDLMKQGLATDRDDAIAQAEGIFKQQDSDSYSEIRETIQEIKEEVKPEETTESAVDLSQDQIKDILKQNTEFVVKKFREFQDKISSLEKEISSLRTKLTYKELPTAEQIAPSKKEEVTVQEAVEIDESSESEEKPAESKGPDHPRSGSYKTDDVSIEKFFYMGSK